MAYFPSELLFLTKQIKNIGDVKKISYLCDRKEVSGCSSARLEYASGGRVVGRSNRLTPTIKNEGLTVKCKSF